MVSAEASYIKTPRDNLFLIKNFKNPETTTVSGFSFYILPPNWCKFGANIKTTIYTILKFLISFAKIRPLAKGNVPVSLSIDEEEFNQRLIQKQLGSKITSAASKDAKHTEYSERWQINW